MVTEEKESGAVDVICPSSGNDVDCPAAGGAGGRIEIEAGDFKLLHGFLREVEHRAAV